MRKYGWVWLMWAAEALYHSSWHWQSEQRWSEVRRCIQGKHFGRSNMPEDPFSLAQGPEKEAVLRKICEDGVKEYVSTLRNYAEDRGHNWEVVTRSPEDPVQDGHIQDKQLLKEMYECKTIEALSDERFASLHDERLDVGKLGSFKLISKQYSEHYSEHCIKQHILNSIYSTVQ